MLPANTTGPTVKGSQAICFTITDSDGAGNAAAVDANDTNVFNYKLVLTRK